MTHLHRITLIIVAALALAPAAQAGETWTQQPQFALGPTLEWEGDAVQEPNIEYDAKRKIYRMWYTGGPFGHNFTGYAVSKDLKTWAKSSLPVLGMGRGGEPGNAYHATVQKLNGTYYAWYSVQGWTNPDGALHVATSPDGVHWTPRKKPALPMASWARLYANTYVVRDGDHWLMFWESFNPVPDGRALWEMGTATSTDLINWKQSFTKLSSIGFGDTYGGPHIIREGNQWAMYFHAPKPDMTGGYSVIFKSTSRDLKTWKSDPTPVVSGSGGWHGDQIADASVVTVGSRRLMFFTGLDNTYPLHGRIGMAELSR